MLLMLNNFFVIKDSTYVFMVSIIILITAISLMIAVFKSLCVIREHYYSSQFITFFKNSNDFEEALDYAEMLKTKSIIAKAFISAFKAFYRVYKLNPNYQSGSSIALSTRTMELVVNKNISNNTGYSLILYLSFIIPGLAICCIIYNYSNYIEIYKSFANIDPKILVDSLRLFFLSLASSLIMSSLFILLDKYSDYRLLSFKYFIDEYAFIIHKKFYSKEYDIEN